MRPPRIAILVLFFAASLFLFCRSLTSLSRSAPIIAPATTTTTRSPFASFFSFNAPFTLFPPNAAISLTDDNSTSFAARPAAFGPPLPTKGLSGQLWIGSGFAEDSLQDGEGEGELGCSDIPGWDDGTNKVTLKVSAKASSKANSRGATQSRKTGPLKRESDLGGNPKGPVVDRAAAPESLSQTVKARPVDDGTDDYLHQGLATSSSSKSAHDSNSQSGTAHADIQSIQEAAEIAGKIVLLSRGGCGFLEKVKWAQRRGAIALIVGDNQKGGPLIQMFARGDTSNVTIPSVFTARTTAHLLSSLTQPGSFIEDTIDENGRPTLKVQQAAKGQKGRKTKQPTPVPTGQVTTKPTATAKAAKPAPARKRGAVTEEKVVPMKEDSRGWFARIFSFGGSKGTSTDSSRPPSSGRLDWVLVDDWSDEKDKMIRDSMGKASKRGHSDSSAKTPARQATDDDFLIGVHDWRDPDLVPEGKSKPATGDTKSSSKEDKASSVDPMAASKNLGRPGSGDSNGPKGGSITPGSGEYPAGSAKTGSPNPDPAGSSTSGSGLMSKIFGDDDGADFTSPDSTSSVGSSPAVSEDESSPGDGTEPPESHEGLWVTITPSSSASTFFDTLLVLVISPLITLTVVYALLILRARIRRRRWRAPKSVVERLPVRTYHTVASSSPSHSPRLPSPTSSSPTTPLLQQQGQHQSHSSTSPTRSRPRSRTTTGIPESDGLLTVASAAMPTGRNPSSRTDPHEKGSSGLSSEWKKYMGRQVECVVCLEEYIDGVSRVMSLPCGHEFHVECITPWLTTRRRTCPICKGDVVRSLARGSPSSPRYEPYHDDSDEDDGADMPPSARGDRETHDVEQGILSSRGRRNNTRQDGWLSILSSSLGASSRSSQASHEDRTR